MPRWNRRHVLAALPLGWRGLYGRFATGTAQGSAATTAAETSSGGRQPDVEVRVLGTAQDGGVPQINCFKDHCARVRAGTASAPRVACLGLIDHIAGKRFIIDATPDFARQVGTLLAPHGVALEQVAGATVPLHEHLHGLLLTHAHIGHYAGLVHLGKEVAAPRNLPLWASPRMGEFLHTNAPWEALFRNGFAEHRVAVAGTRIQLTEQLAVTPFQVVHRPEYSDTLGYLVHGPQRTLMYVPDADVWDGWETPFEQLLRSADMALIDGSFWSHEELGHRLQADIPHPPVSATLERLKTMPGCPQIWFTHMNHTNPLWDEHSPRHASLPAGYGVARDGQSLAI